MCSASASVGTMARAAATLDHIGRDLAAIDPADLAADLAGGAAGIALFFAYRAQVEPPPSAR